MDKRTNKKLALTLKALPLLLLALSSCASGASSDSSGGLTPKTTYTWSHTVIASSIIASRNTKCLLWGLFAFEPYLTDHINIEDLCPGDILNLKFSATKYYIKESIPSTAVFENYEFISATVDMGLMKEVEVIDGVAQLEKAGLTSYLYEGIIGDAAIDENGNPVELKTLDKVYAGVSVEDKTAVCGLMTYPFRN